MLRTEIYVPARRRDVAFAIVIALFAILIGRFYYLQVYRYEQYSLMADANRIRPVTMPAPRGRVLDRNGEILTANRSIYAISVIKDELIDEDVQLNMLARYLERDETTLAANMEKYYQGRFLPTLITKDVPLERLGIIEEHRNELPGVLSTRLPVRFYPNPSGARLSHVLGYLREIDAKELDSFENGDYALGDYLGSQGLEKYYERHLRGVKGIEYKQVDALGREVGHVADREPISAEPGEDLRLTIDTNLQHHVESLLDGYRGAAVVMNAASGEILAMASKPDFPLTDFSAGMDLAEWLQYSSDEDRPLLNRAVLGLYPPGSSMKLLTAIAALERRMVSLEWTVDCTGSYDYVARFSHCT